MKNRKITSMFLASILLLTGCGINEEEELTIVCQREDDKSSSVEINYNKDGVVTKIFSKTTADMQGRTKYEIAEIQRLYDSGEMLKDLKSIDGTKVDVDLNDKRMITKIESTVTKDNIDELSKQQQLGIYNKKSKTISIDEQVKHYEIYYKMTCKSKK